jgi:hypothetical protein
LIIVTWLPRVTVMVDGHTWLFWMTIVFGLELGVQPPVDPDGPVLLLPPHAVARVNAAAAADPAITILNMRMETRLSFGWLLAWPYDSSLYFAR